MHMQPELLWIGLFLLGVISVWPSSAAGGFIPAGDGDMLLEDGSGYWLWADGEVIAWG